MQLLRGQPGSKYIHRATAKFVYYRMGLWKSFRNGFGLVLGVLHPRYFLAITIAVFAGLDRASYSLAYTAAVGAYAISHKGNPGKIARFLLHPGCLIIVLLATVQDVAGHSTVWWPFIVMCWCVSGYLGIEIRNNAELDTRIAPGLLFVSSAMALWQILD